MKWFMAMMVVAVLLGSGDAVAQRMRMGERPGPERLEQFRKMRMIEALKLNEDDAVRFAAKQRAHEDTQKDLMKERNAALDDLERMLKETGGADKAQKLIDEVLESDRKIFNERVRYHEEMRKFLTPEQFARFVLFERNFGRQVRNALDELREERR